MAHFIQASDGQRVSGKEVLVPLNGKVQMGLWGWEESAGNPLDIQLASPDVASFGMDLTRAPAGIVRDFEIHGNRMGKTRVSAIASNGAMWDWFDAVVVTVDST